MRVFVNQEQKNWIKLLLMAKFAYNNAINTSTNFTLFKLNYRFRFQILFKENVDARSQLCLANKLANKLRELIEICYQNLLYI